MVVIARSSASASIQHILLVTTKHFEIRALPDPQLALPEGSSSTRCGFAGLTRQRLARRTYREITVLSLRQRSVLRKPDPIHRPHFITPSRRKMRTLIEEKDVTAVNLAVELEQAVIQHVLQEDESIYVTEDGWFPFWVRVQGNNGYVTLKSIQISREPPAT